MCANSLLVCCVAFPDVSFSAINEAFGATICAFTLVTVALAIKSAGLFGMKGFFVVPLYNKQIASMRVLIVNTSEKTGGAAVAAKRLMEALNNNGVKAKMLVRDKETEDIKVVGLSHSPIRQWHFLWERWCIFCRLHFSRKHLFEIDIANSGNDITKLREFQEADVIHLHWINQGMLSLSVIGKILKSGKPIVWTMHDAWPATAICHYTRGCNRFVGGCGYCHLLPSGGSRSDLAAAVWARKKKLLDKYNISFVACSRWLEGEAKKSALLARQDLTNIPNTIDTHIFRPTDKDEAKMKVGLPLDKRLILFVSQKVTDLRKGVDYFIEAVSLLVKEHPALTSDIGIAILGGHSEDIADKLPLPTYPLGYVNDEKTIVAVYNSADAFVLPSLEDNLPNTIMEAMACGVPCVGFKIGGIPEMIDHGKNGYVAVPRDHADLAKGIYWVLDKDNNQQLSKEAVRKVAMSYSQASVAMKYIEVYNTACAFKRYKL